MVYIASMSNYLCSFCNHQYNLIIMIKIFNMKLTSANIIIYVILLCKLLSWSKLLYSILALITCGKFTGSSFIIKCESFLALITKCPRSFLIKNAVTTECWAFFALRSHHTWGHGSYSFTHFHFWCKASIICEKMLHIWSLLAIRVAVTKVIPLNVSKIFLAGDALVRSVTCCASNWAEFATQFVILILASLAVIGGLFPLTISFSIEVGH